MLNFGIPFALSSHVNGSGGCSKEPGTTRQSRGTRSPTLGGTVFEIPTLNANPAIMSRGSFEDSLESAKRSPGRPIQRSNDSRDQLPVRSLPTQTRDGFISQKVLTSLESGKNKGPIKLLPGSAKELAVKSAGHLKK